MRLSPIAIITGATRGIGKEITKKLSSNGINCISIGSSNDSIKKIKLNDHFKFVTKEQHHGALAVDLANWPYSLDNQEIETMDLSLNSNQLVSELSLETSIFNLIDKWNLKDKNTSATNGYFYYTSLLVNCAGVTQENISIKNSNETIEKIMNVNFMSAVTLCNKTIKRMLKERRQIKMQSTLQKTLLPPTKTKIINISSALGNSDYIIPGTSIYAASKSALSCYSKILNKEIEKTKIKISSLQINLVKDTDMIKDLFDSSGAQHLDHYNLPLDTKENIANRVLKLYLED